MADETTPQAPATGYAIDLDWYQKSPRSFTHAVRASLCAKCQRKIEGKEISPRKIIDLIKGCCSNETGFISDRQPILESVFRVFLSNGNKPMRLDELAKQLSEKRGGDVSRTNPQVLARLLNREDYYGIHSVSG